MTLPATDPAVVLVSVVICTYNRADLLRQVLQEACTQVVDGAAYEVVVVDNNSSDETAAVIAASQRSSPRLRTVFEARQGLSNARNRGWRQARGAYVAFLDDDARVSEHWLQTALGLIRQHQPAAFGGPYRPFYLSERPAWYRDQYGSHTPYAETTWLPGSADELHGGNLFVRRELIERVGGFRADLGMSGEQPGYGEETALLRAIRVVEPRAAMIYEPRLGIEHWVRADKMTLSWLLRYRFVSGRDHIRMATPGSNCAGMARLLWRALLSAGRLLITVPWAAVFRNRTRYPYWMNYIYEQASWRIFTLGWLYQCGRDRVRADRAAISN